jgi:hypothetical protein
VGKEVLLGFNADARGDDVSVITSLGGTTAWVAIGGSGSVPAAGGDADKLDKDAIARVELQINRKFDIERVYRSWPDLLPTAYDLWSMDQGRILLLSIKSKTAPNGQIIPFGEIASGARDAEIDAHADRLVAGVTGARIGKLWLCYNHEPTEEDGYGTLLDGNHGAGSVTLTVDPTPIGVSSVPFTTKLKRPGGSTVNVTIIAPFSVGATSISINTLGTLSEDNSRLWLQSRAQAGADFIAAWARIKSRMLARAGFSALGVKWVPIFIHGSGTWNDVSGYGLFYPASSDVDYIGFDGAYVGPPNVDAQPFSSFFDAPGNSALSWMRSKGKPIIIGETSVNEEAADPNAAGDWLTALGAYLKTLEPDIRAFVYYSGTGGWFLDGSPYGSDYKLARYRALALDPHFRQQNVVEVSLPAVSRSPSASAPPTAFSEKPPPRSFGG